MTYRYLHLTRQINTVNHASDLNGCFDSSSVSMRRWRGPGSQKHNCWTQKCKPCRSTAREQKYVVRDVLFRLERLPPVFVIADELSRSWQDLGCLSSTPLKSCRGRLGRQDGRTEDTTTPSCRWRPSLCWGRSSRPLHHRYSPRVRKRQGRKQTISARI